MGDPLSFRNSRVDSLYLATEPPYQVGRDEFADLVNAYGQKLRETARMLLRADWYKITKDNEDFKTIIASIKDVYDNLNDVDDDPRVDMDSVLKNLREILHCLHRAGERAEEKDFSLREVKYQEFGECYQNLVIMAKLLKL